MKKIDKICIISMDWFGGLEKYYQNAFKNICSVCDIAYYPKQNDLDIIRKLKQLSVFDFTNKSFPNFIDKLLKKEFRRRLFDNLTTKYDFFFIIKGDYFDENLLTELKEFNPAIYSIYFIDNPFWSLGKIKQYYPNIINTLKLYDYIFSFDSYYIPLLKKLSENDKVHYLPFACDLDCYYPDKIKEKKYLHNVSFVASANYEREKLLSELTHNIKIFGPGWDKKLYENIIDKSYSTEEINNIYNSTKINLNLNALNSIYGTNARTFEIIGSSGFLLNDYKEELEELFEIDSDLVCYNSALELNDKIDFYLKNDSLRFKIANSGYSILKNNHTYNHRINYLLKILQNNE